MRIQNVLKGRFLMQATQHVNEKTFSPIHHHTYANLLLQRAAQKLRTPENTIDIIEHIIPPNDDDSSCFVKSSN